MSFTEWFDKLKIKLFAPVTLYYRDLGGISQCELKYWAMLPAFMIFEHEPIGEDGYYQTVYVNNKRIKRFDIIPRNAFIEVRRKPKAITAFITGIVAAVGSALGVSTAVAGVIVGVAAAAIVGGAITGLALATTMGRAGMSNGTDRPTYSSKNAPDLSGAKNELAEDVVPVAFGRTLQTFNYGQYCYPLVRSGYSGNRYKTYSIAGYQNARYEDFRLGDVLLSNYRQTAYSIQQANGQANFIGWDNAVTENFNRELSFDKSQAVYQSAIAYYNQGITNPTHTLQLTQTYQLTGVNLAYWSDKAFDIKCTVVVDGADIELLAEGKIKKTDLVQVEGDTYNATITINVEDTEESHVLQEYRYTSTSPNGSTRGNSNETNLFVYLLHEKVTIGEQVLELDVNQGVNSYSGDRCEIISQSLHDTKFCDMHFSFPSGLYSINKNTAARVSVSISAEIFWKRVDETAWHDINDTNITRIYTRNIDGEIENLSSRITRNGNVFTFRSPDNMNDADDKFYECVGLEFLEAGHYQIKVLPVTFDKDDYWVGSIYLSEVVWRLDPSIPVVAPEMLPHVTQIACTFNATTQLDGEIDKFGAVVRPYIKNIATGRLEQSRNPVDIIYYLLTDTHSNPNPMTDEQIDMPSFLKARKWCEDHNCLCDGIVSDELKYESIINEIASNNQLYFIPNKWGKAVIRVDTNEDGRPIKTLFNAENSWDLSVIRTRGKFARQMAIRATYIDEETWSEKEVTGYWYNNQCNWQPEDGKDDTYYQPEKRDLTYVKNLDNVKRRIAYELEISNAKNTTAKFKVAREVLDLEVLDRVLVADYTRIDDGVSGSIDEVLLEDGKVIGFKTSSPFKVKENMSITVRSVDTSGEGFNVNTYNLKENPMQTSFIMLENPIPASDNIIRGTGFYNIDGTEFYYSGDLYMAGTAEILNMVISNIDEVSGEDFTSSITCRLF